MDFENIYILAQKELRDALRNRWFLLYALAFAALSLALAWTALSGAGNYGLAGFGRTAASMINLILLIVPLMGLTLGAMSLAGEREQGTLLYLLAQPINQFELLAGKFIGLALALIAALVLGFGLTGLVLTLFSNSGNADIGIYLNLLLLAGLLAIASLSIGFLISAAAKRGATAVGLALFVWLTLVFLGDLGVMGTALMLQLDVGQLLLMVLTNPLQVFKIAAVYNLRDNLEVLGPAGLYAMRTYGSRLLPLLIGLLLLWIVVPFFGTSLLFKKRGAI